MPAVHFTNLLIVVAIGLLARARSVIAGLLQATSLTFTVTATQIGLQLGVITQATAAGSVAAGLLSVVISPALALVLLRRQQPDTHSKFSARPSRTGWTARVSSRASSTTPPA